MEQERPWALASLPALALLLFPGAGGRHGYLHFTGVVPGPLMGRDSRRGPLSSLKMQGGWGQEFGLSRRWGSWAIPGVWVILYSPFPFSRTTHLPFISLWQGRSGASCWGHLEAGPGVPVLHGRGRVCAPCCRGPTPKCPTSVFCTPLSSLQGREQASPKATGRLACVVSVGALTHQPYSHCALCSWLLCWEGGASKRRGVQAEATPCLLSTEG